MSLRSRSVCIGLLTVLAALWLASPVVAAFESVQDAKRAIRHLENQDPTIDGFAIRGCTRFSSVKIKCGVSDHGQRSTTKLGTYNYECQFTVVVRLRGQYLYAHGSHATCQTQTVVPPASQAPMPAPTPTTTITTPSPPPPPAPTPTTTEGVGSYDHSGDAIFCATRICIGSFTTEPGYVVECYDGTYNHAGGIQGACSGHGGVNPFGS
jgi:hypothetical protein